MTITSPVAECEEKVSAGWFIEGCFTADGIVQRISIPYGRFQIGRRSDMNLILARGNISKLHAEFVATEVGLFVRDLGSTNGTFVNGHRITATPIEEDDIVQFADVEFVVGRTVVEDALRTMACSSEDWQTVLVQFQQLMSTRAIAPAFQPIVRFNDGVTIGHEVLARSKILGLTSAYELFSTAERLRVASKLSVLCRERGIETAKKLAKPGVLFLNTHPEEQPEAGLLESLVQLRKLAPDLEMVLELHEAAVTNPRAIAAFRQELRNLRIQLAYDDFGAGQARLIELSEVAPDFIKFDIGLIRDLHVAPQRQQVVAGLVKIVRELGIQALAEGVELAAEAEICRQIGFTHAQGFLFGRPTTAEGLA